MFRGTGMPEGCLWSLTCFSFSTGKVMMPLNLKSTRHLLTTPHMQARDTEDTLASQEGRPTGSHTGWGTPLWAQTRGT